MTQSVQLGEKVEIPVNIDHAGPNIVEIEAEPAKGELTTVNNRAVLTVEGVRENLRVLLVSGEPHAGERTWRNMLKSDASVDLVHFTILRPPEKQDGTPINQLSLIAFPTRELFQEKLDQFDLIIFDRYQRRGVLPLLYLENVARYVEKGGAVLVSAGDDYASPLSLYRSPLGQILPAVPSGRVIEEPFKPTLTELGEKHPVTSDLPGASGAGALLGTLVPRRRCRARAKAEVLMKGAQGKPLLIIGQRGEGRVGMLLSDHAWLWARGYEGGGPYTDLLRRLAHWLMKEPDLEEETLKATSRGQTLSIERRSIKDEVEPVTVTAPSGKEETVTLDKGERGLWRKAMTVSEQGVYRIASGKLASVVTVGNANARELAAVTATDAVLSPILDETGGGSFWLGRDEADAAQAAAPRDAARRPGHARRRLARAAQARRLSRQGRAPVPAVHRLARARPVARPAGRHLVPRRPLARMALDRARGALQRARNQLEREQPRGIDRTRQRDLPRRHGLEAEPSVIGHVADEQHEAEAFGLAPAPSLPRPAPCRNLCPSPPDRRRAARAAARPPPRRCGSR